MAIWLDKGWQKSPLPPKNVRSTTRRPKDILINRSKRSIPFVPGAFLISMGLIVILFPRFFLFAIAALLIFLGVALCAFAWKLMETKHKLDSLVKDLDGKIQVHNFEIRAGESQPSEESRSKKIVYH